MYGRICVGLLLACLLSASLLPGQSVESRRDVPESSSLLANSRAGSRAMNEVKQQGAVVSVPLSPVSPVTPSLPSPLREPLPWRPPISSTESGFAQIARKAGMIFSGTVIRVDRASTAMPGEAIGTIAITFRVESPIRGASAGELLTIRQWIGLWSSGQRYSIGERLFLFLYPRSKVGLTSCVAAGMGRFAIDSSGSIQLSPQQILAFRTDPVLGGRSRVHLSDFASAVRWAGEEK